MSQSQIFGNSSISSSRSTRRNSEPSIEGMDKTTDTYFSSASTASVSPISSIYSSKLLSSIQTSPTASTSFSSATTLQSPVPSPSTSAATRTFQHRLNAAQEQRTYHDSCRRLTDYLKTATELTKELKAENLGRFPMFYSVKNHPASKPAMARSQTLDPNHAHIIDEALKRRSSTTSAPTSSTTSTPTINNTFEQPRLIPNHLNVLALNLKMGHSEADISNLESKSVAHLLDEKLKASLAYLNKLSARVSDTSSKVLVTGDLNSGKSTLVNALLKREILPVDQQPCTSIFCEVLDANLVGGVEQLHGVFDPKQYDITEPSTYHKLEMRHLYKIITDDYEPYAMLKLYTKDARTTQESLLHNGVVNIALIDSPGLNTDSVKTTAVFARQEEIDVVVFVVSAENHFTLSGKEFLWNAANEKTHIFIVVNRFDSIRDKERCKRLILEQIRQLSPATYADADDLVHFVSAGNVDLEPGSYKLDAPEFARLEQRLRAFVLENRTKSKLLPAKNYLVNLLCDINILSEASEKKSSDDYVAATEELERDLPAYQQLLKVRDRLLDQVEKVAETAVNGIQRHAQNRLNHAVECVNDAIRHIEYPGIFLIWQYAQDVADSMVQSLINEVRQEEQRARQETNECLERLHAMGSEHLGQYEMAADANKMCVKYKEQRLVIPVEATDFFDLVLDEKLSGAALSMGALTMVGGRMLGFKDAVSGIWSVSNMLGNNNNLRRWIAPAVGIASVGFIVYVVSDMRNAVERKLVKKFQQAVKEANYVDGQSSRIARESRKVLRIEGWEIQSRIQKAIEQKEQKRNETKEAAALSKATASYFNTILVRSSMLLDKVQAVQCDSQQYIAKE